MKLPNMLISLLLILSSGASLADDYQAQIDQFFRLVEAKQTEQAIEFIYASNPYASTISTQIEELKRQIGLLPSIAGKVHQIELIDTHRLGDSLVTLTYIVNYDRMPIRFVFQYFKTQKGWRIISFAFDDDIADEAKAHAKQRALNPMQNASQ